jgi:phage host-nuclease inhibitor protein Gam
VNQPPLPDNTASDNQNVINQIDDFIAGLNSEDKKVISKNYAENLEGVKVEVPKTEQEIQDFILKNSAQLATLSVKSVKDLQQVVTATGDPEQMASLASLIIAGAGAIETINKIHLQNKKAEANKDLKKLDLEGKKELQRLKNDGYLNLPQSNTNILVATREEVIAQLTGKVKAKTVNVTNEVIELELGQPSSQPSS